MSKGLIKIISLISFLLAGCSDLNTIETTPKSISKKANYVFAEGRWKALPGSRASIISKINFTSITCDRNNMTCNEIESLVFTPKEQPILKKNLLYNQEFSYEIIDWTDDIIKAKREAPVADIEITISIKDRFAEKSYRETKARGSDTADPNIYGKWILE
jgi:predicted small secreted protein